MSSSTVENIPEGESSVDEFVLAEALSSNNKDSKGKKKSNKTSKNKEKKIRLGDKWKFWFEKGTSKESYNIQNISDNLLDKGDFKFIQDFWEIYGKLDPLSKLLKKDSFHLFKVLPDGYSIKPLWEDKENALGGIWTFRVPADKASDCWQNLLLGVIGAQFEDCLDIQDSINGVSVSSRIGDYVFQIWNKQANAPNRQAIMKKAQDILQKYEIKSPFYKVISVKSELVEKQINNNNNNTNTGTNSTSSDNKEDVGSNSKPLVEAKKENN